MLQDSLSLNRKYCAKRYPKNLNLFAGANVRSGKNNHGPLRAHASHKNCSLLPESLRLLEVPLY